MEGVRFYAKLKIVTARWSTGIGVGAKCAFNVRSYAGPLKDSPKRVIENLLSDYRIR
jgi:hypothetical protein